MNLITRLLKAKRINREVVDLDRDIFYQISQQESLSEYLGKDYFKPTIESIHNKTQVLRAEYDAHMDILVKRLPVFLLNWIGLKKGI